MKKVLITGANSYIGASVENYIKEHYPDECEFYTIDMIDKGWREISFSGYDVVFHVAGIAHRKETRENAELYYKVNRDLAIDVAQKAKSDGVAQFIFLSSMSVYGLLNGRITKDTVLKPNTYYGKSKLQAEKGITPLSDDTFKVCIIRPPMIYGKSCKGNYTTLVKLAMKLKIFPYVKNERSMLYIDNLCEFVRQMIANGEKGIFFPQNNEYSNTSEMVEMIAIVHGRKLRLMHGFGLVIKFLGIFTRSVKKAFGSLTYDKDMSMYKEDYIKYTLRQSIEETER